VVSAIIPVYNRRHLVGRAIRSVLKQSWTEVEIIVVDDGSEDGTGRGISDAFGEDVRLLRHERNQGVSAARNTGIAAATGTWLALLDSDDEWIPTKLERQMEAVLGSGLRVSHTDDMRVTSSPRPLPSAPCLRPH